MTGERTLDDTDYETRWSRLVDAATDFLEAGGSTVALTESLRKHQFSLRAAAEIAEYAIALAGNREA